MSATGLESNPWIRRYRPAPDANARLACFPHAGGSASFYAPVARALAPAVEVLAIQYPGRQDRMYEPHLESMDDLADQAARALLETPGPAGVPLALFGHSMGATLAFEVARRLERAGTPPSCLFASGRRAPSQHRDDRAYLRDDAALVADLRALNGTDPQLLEDRELLRLLLPTIRADYKAAETHRPAPGSTVSCPVVALIGDSDPQASVEDARAWAEHTTGPFTLRVFTGGHFYLTEHAAAVLDVVSGRLRR